MTMTTKRNKITTTEKRESWGKSRGAAVFGKPLHYCPSAPAAYSRALEVLMLRMREDYERRIKRLERTVPIMDGLTPFMDASFSSQARILMNELGDKWARIFKKNSKRIIDHMMASVDKDATTRLKSSLKELSGGIAITPPKFTGQMEERIKAAMAENVSLITSVGDQFRERVAGYIYRSISGEAPTSEQGMHGVFKALTEYEGMGVRRARNIALDQTRKLSVVINTERMKSVGVKKFRWQHSGGGAEPRRLHKYDLNGRIFSFDDLPIIDERTGERGLPAQLPNCKCVMIPVLDFSDAD